jgi:hypothetical protein
MAFLILVHLGVFWVATWLVLKFGFKFWANHIHAAAFLSIVGKNEMQLKCAAPF